VVVTARQIASEDRVQLNGDVPAIMEKALFNPEHFTADVRRAMSGREVAA
jgi:hypothetical protein